MVKLFFFFFSVNIFAHQGVDIVDDNYVYLALSSDERSYYKNEQNYKDFLATLIEERAKALCVYYGHSDYTHYETVEVMAQGLYNAWVPDESDLRLDSFELVRQAQFTDDGHKKLGNALWYIGHTLTCFSIVGALSYWPYFEGVTTLIPPFFVVLSQAVTMASRVIERSTPNEISYDEAEERRKAKKIVHSKRVKGPVRPHLIFTKIICNRSSSGYQELP